MELADFFREHPSVAVAFSGGTDSSYLLCAALQCGARVRAYFVQTAFQPRFERNDAVAVTRALGADLTILETDILALPAVVENPPERCYFCKNRLMSLIASQAAADGFETVADGTNASDDDACRPGMRALRELGVRSPLRECGLTKAEIRRLSKQAGLLTWEKPAYACLATRIPTGTPITAQKLQKTQDAEAFLTSLGFSDFRVRYAADAARIQLPLTQLTLLLEKRSAVLDRLKQDYSSVFLDLEVRDG